MTRCTDPAGVCVFETLEERRLLAAPPGPRPDNLAAFGTAQRQALLDRLDNHPLQADLAAKLPGGSSTAYGAFDGLLHDYMRDRTNVSWYFADEDAAQLGDYIDDELDASVFIGFADAIVDDRLFPADNSSDSFIVPLPGDVDWVDPGDNLPGAGAEFLHTLNRFEYWQNLTDAYLVTGQAKYADEIMYELADWSAQFTTMGEPRAWSGSDRLGWQLDTSLRSASMTWAYFALLGTRGMSQEANALFMYKLIQHGDVMADWARESIARDNIANNRALAQGKALHMLGVMFPELDVAGEWAELGRRMMRLSLEQQVYPDGGHLEQSPGYQLNITQDALEAYWLDKINGAADAWGKTPKTLANAVESYRQLVSPNGDRPGLGDTYRIPSYTLFLKAGFILDKIDPITTSLRTNVASGDTVLRLASTAGFSVGDFLAPDEQREVMRVVAINGSSVTVERGLADTSARNFGSGDLIHNLGHEPFAKPRTRDVWLLGEQRTRPFMEVPPNPPGALGARGNAYALPDSGLFVLRSDDTEDATQITFDAGPKGFFHGHYDPLGIEVFAGGRPLVIDPGPYQYDNSAERDYVLSTAAHNTINVDGRNVAVMEDPDGTGPARNEKLRFSHEFARDYAQITASHDGYAELAGAPKLTRSLWYDYNGTLVIADFVDASAVHDYQIGFNLPAGAADTTGTTLGLGKTRYADGGSNVAITPICGGTFQRTPTFVTDINSSDYARDAYRFTMTQTQKTAIFLTLVQVYDGRTVPDVDVRIEKENLNANETFSVTLIRDGVDAELVTFSPAGVTPRETNFDFDGTFNDIAADEAGNVHAVWLDRQSTHLMYAVRDASSSAWSAARVVDDTNVFAGLYPDLEIDNNGRPGVAYFDGDNGDLRYANLDANADWQLRTVDAAGSTGLYPSLMFTRSSNLPVIAYYDRSAGDLNIADATTVDFNTWNIDAFITDGDVGRFAEIRNDPNDPGRDYGFVVGFESTSAGQYRYAHRVGSKWRVETIADPDMAIAGGYLSLDFENVAGRWEPRASYYESAPDTSLKYAERRGDGTWSVVRLDGTGPSRSAGIYSELRIDAGNVSVFYRDAGDDRLVRGARAAGQSRWAYQTLATGGREIHTARAGNQIFLTNLDETNGELSVLIR